MSRIDAILAPQIGDLVRPQSLAVDRQTQNQAAQSKEDEDSVTNSSQPVSAEHVRSAAAQLKQVIEAASSQRLSLDIDKDTDQTFMRVTDTRTGEVIKQIPSKEMLQLHARLQAFIGLFIDRKA